MNPPRSGPDARAATNASTTSALIVASAETAPRLQRLLETNGADISSVSTVSDLKSALEWLARARFDAVLIDVDSRDFTNDHGVSRVRGAAKGAALVLIAEDPAALRSYQQHEDAWVSPTDSAIAIVDGVRGAVERRRLREALRTREVELEKSESRFRSIIERTADGVVIVVDGRVRFVNSAAEQLFERSAAELVGEDFGFAVLAGETMEIDILRHPGRAPIVAEMRVSTTTWDGAPAQLVSLRDITDRKQAEERAKAIASEKAARAQAEKASERSRFLAEASAALDASLDPEKTLGSLAELIVPKMADWCIIDLMQEDVIRRMACQHADPRKLRLIEELQERFPTEPESVYPAARVLQSGAPVLRRSLDPDALRELADSDEHARLLSRLGFHSCLAVPLQVRGRRLGVMTLVCGEREYDEFDLALAQEIANRAARALENARLYEVALAANRAKADFLAVMSHELRTPLNAILGYTDLLLAGVHSEVDDTEYLHRVHVSATQLLQMIEEILTYAQAEAGNAEIRPCAVQLDDLLREIVAVAEPLAREKGLEFLLEMSRPHPTVFTDVAKLRQIILDLLTNAVKFTERGSISVCVEAAEDDLLIAVSDSGIGIAPDQLEKVFEPFRQAEQGPTRRVGGTGLGLSVARHLARLLGGEISVESRLGQGSTFTLRMPRRSAAMEAERDGEPRGGSGHSNHDGITDDVKL